MPEKEKSNSTSKIKIDNKKKSSFLPDIDHEADLQRQPYGISSNRPHTMRKYGIFDVANDYASILVSRTGIHPFLFVNHRMVCKHMVLRPNPLYAIH